MSKAAVSSAASGDSPAVSRLTELRTAFGELTDTERFDEAFGEAGVGGGERDDEAKQAYAIDIFLDEDAALRPIRQVDDTYELVVVDEREAGEGPRCEILIV